jgi:hypothetical protein
MIVWARKGGANGERFAILSHRALGFWKRVVAVNFKLFLTFFQMILLFRYVYLITYPDAYLRFLEVFSVFSFDLFDLLHLQCVFGHVNFIARMYTVGTLVLCIELAIAAIVVFQRTNQIASNSTRERLRQTQRVMNFFVFVSYPFVCSMLFQVHNCRTVDTLPYLHADYSIECHTAEHRSASIFSGFLIALVAIGTPFLYMLLLFPHRDEIRSLMGRNKRSATSRHLRFLFSDYRPEWYYWEVVVCTLKLTITGFAVWFAPGTLFQIVIGMLVLFLYSMLLLQCKPYLSPLHNSLAVFQSAAVFLSLLAALLLKIGDIGNMPNVELGYSSNFVTGALISTAAALLISAVLSGIRDSQLAIVKVVVSTSETSWPPQKKDAYKVGAVVRAKWGEDKDGKDEFQMANITAVAVGGYSLELAHRSSSGVQELTSVPVSDIEGEVQHIMRLVERISRTRADFIFGYDWCGSSTSDERDANANFSDKAEIKASYWFKGYCDAIRGEIKTLSQMPQVKTLRLICIKGGPITQLEQETILTVVEETTKDLQAKEVNADIEVVSLNFSPVEGAPTGTSFEEMYLQPWSCQAIAQGVSRFLRSACTDDTTPDIASKADTRVDEMKSATSNPMMNPAFEVDETFAVDELTEAALTRRHSRERNLADGLDFVKVAGKLSAVQKGGKPATGSETGTGTAEAGAEAEMAAPAYSI